MHTSTVKPREFTGRHMLVIVIGFFSVVLFANVVMAYLASSTWSGLAVSNGYVASQSFNADHARAKAQAAAGWKVELSHNTGALAIVFAGRDAAPLSGLIVSGQLRRPTTERDDVRLVFLEGRSGTYEAPARLAAGVWEVEVDTTGYRQTFRFVVKP